MATEKFFVFNEDGALKRLKGRIVRFLDNEDPTGSDKSAIRTSLEVSPDAAGLVQADVGTAPNEIPVNGMLGDMAYQSSDGLSVGSLEITDKIDLSGAPTQQLEVYGDAPTVRVTDTSDGVGDGDSIGKLEFYGNDGSSGGVGVRAKIDTVSETAAGNQYGVAISTSTANSTPVERVRVDGQGRVSIGNNSPGSFHSSADDLVIGQTASATHSGITVANASGGTGSVFFAKGTSGDALYRGQIQYAHGSDTMYFATAGASAWSINSSGNFVAATGKGIDFGSTTTGSGTVATNGGLLDDYEFGDFTVTAGGTWTVTPTSMAGKYLKVGNLVTCWVTFGGSPSKTSATSGWLEGLPFATNVYNGQGSVSDTSVADRGNCYAANVNRLWLTGTSFGANNYATVSYRHD